MRAEKYGSHHKNRKVSMKTIHVVAGILWREGKYLAVRRPENKPMPGMWEFPGGKLENHETPEQALRRELKEELGVTPVAYRFWNERAHQYSELAVHLYFFHIHQFTGRPQSLEGHTLLWVTPQDALNLPFLEADNPIVHRLHEAPAPISMGYF